MFLIYSLRALTSDPYFKGQELIVTVIEVFVCVLAFLGVILPQIRSFKSSIRSELPFVGKVPIWNLFGLIFPITPRTYINGVGFWEQSFYMTPIILLGLFSHNWFLWGVCICVVICMTMDIKLYKWWGDRVRARACVPLCVALILMFPKLTNTIETILLCLVMWGLLVNKRIFPYEPFDKERYDLNNLPVLIGNESYRTNNLPYPWFTGILHKIRSVGYVGSSANKYFVHLRGGGYGSHNIFHHLEDGKVVDELGVKYSYGDDPSGWEEIEKGVWENPRL